MKTSYCPQVVPGKGFRQHQGYPGPLLGKTNRSRVLLLLLSVIACIMVQPHLLAQQLFLKKLGDAANGVRDSAVSSQGYSFIVGDSTTAGQGSLHVLEPFTGVVRPATSLDFSPRTIAVADGPDTNSVYLYIGGNFTGPGGSAQGRVRKYQYTLATPGALTSLATYDVFGTTAGGGSSIFGNSQEVADLAVDRGTNVVFTGRFKGSLTTYGGPQSSGGADWQIYVMKLDSNLTRTGGWFKQWGIRANSTVALQRTISSSYSFTMTVKCGVCETPLTDDVTFSGSFATVTEALTVVPGATQSKFIEYSDTTSGEFWCSVDTQNLDFTASLTAVESWGSPDDDVFSLALDGQGNVYVSGSWAPYSVSAGPEAPSKTYLITVSSGACAVSSSQTVTANVSYTSPTLALTASNVGLETGVTLTNGNHTGYLLKLAETDGGLERYFNTSNGGTTESAYPEIAFKDGLLYAVGQWKGISTFNGTNDTSTSGAFNLEVIILNGALFTPVHRATAKAAGDLVAHSIDLHSDGRAFVSGRFGPANTSWGDVASFSGSTSRFFVAQLENGPTSLIWNWVTPSLELSPNNLGPTKVRWNEASDLLTYAGTFTGGSLRLGDPDDPTVIAKLTAASDTAVVNFVSLYTDQGDIFKQLHLTVVSDLSGPLGDSRTRPRRGTTAVVSGQTITASVPEVVYVDRLGNEILPTGSNNEVAEDQIRTNAVTRYLCTGYTVNDTTTGATSSTGTTRSYSFVILNDTTITFHWKTEHALVIESKVADVGLSGDNALALGNPSPVVKKHWVPQDELVTAFVDATAPAGTSFGQRYRARGYDVGGSGSNNVASGFKPLDTSVIRHQVPQFAMRGWMSITYRWTNQVRVQIGTTSSKSDSLPAIQLNTATPTHTNGSGEFWFDRGSDISIGAKNAGGQALRGWLVGDGDFLPGPSRDLSLLNADFTNSGVTYQAHRIASLVRPTSVTWEYGDQLYREVVKIGNSVAFITTNPYGFPSDEILTVAVSNKIDFSRAPTARIISSPPGSTAQDMQAWDTVARKSYPLRPGRFLLEFHQLPPNENDLVIMDITCGFGGELVFPDDSTKTNKYVPPLRDYRHLAHPDIPDVDLDPSPADAYAFIGLKYSENGATVSGSSFSASLEGRHVLLFSKSPNAAVSALKDLTRETLEVKVTETRLWDSDPGRGNGESGRWDASPALPMVVGKGSAESPAPTDIGTKVADASYDQAGIETGFVVHPNARYNAAIYDRTKVAHAGSIIPVNEQFTTNLADELVIVWYQKSANNILWPHQSVWYAPTWPVHSRFTIVKDQNEVPIPQPLDRIVIASRLGSEGRNTLLNHQQFFDRARFEDVKIYNQPDPNLPGYNPNEEHALIAPSFKFLDQANPPSAAFALRNDLNITTPNSNYTSHPYVLVQYLDRAEGENGEFKMAVYQIEKEDNRLSLNPDRHPEIDPDPANPNDQRAFPYTFGYPMKAGEPVQAPYPLGIVIGLTPCLQTRGENISTNRVYWEDRNGQPWAVSEGRLRAHFFYPRAIDFWIDEGDTNVVPGTCIPFSTSGTVILTGTNANPVFGAGTKQFTLNGQPVSFTGLNAQAFIAAVEAGKGTHHVTAFMLAGGEIRLQSTNAITAADGAGNPLLTAGIKPVAQSLTDGVTFNATWPDKLPILKAGETLTFAGGEYKADSSDAEQPGLPGVVGWAAGNVVFDSANPTMTNTLAFDEYTSRLISPLEVIVVKLTNGTANTIEALIEPQTGQTTVVGTEWKFVKLPSSLQKRVRYEPVSNELRLRGYVNDKTLGDPTLTASPPPVYLLEPNILTSRERAILRDLLSEPKWKDAVDDLYAKSRNPELISKGGVPANGLSPSGYDSAYYTGLELDVEQENGGDKLDANGIPITIPNRARSRPALGPGLALVPSPKFLEPSNDTNLTGYVTLAENDNARVGGPVTLHIVKVVKKHRYRGAIKTILSDNVFDEKITFRHTGDFGANGDSIVYQWFYREENGQAAALPADSAWKVFPDQTDNAIKGLGMHQITLEGAGGLLLADNLLFVRYRHQNDIPADSNNNSVDWTGTEWKRDGANYRDPLERDALGKTDPANPLRFGGQWAGAANSPTVDLEYRPQLAIGWIKRVLDRVNPYEARIADFRNNSSPATYSSMIRQAGPEYVGPVALNPDKNVIENVGLIELYQTILERGMDLSIDLSSPITSTGINTALLLAATRISDFHLLLGNEAYSDALDPLIGFGKHIDEFTEYGSLLPTIFTFQNQVPSLLEEELALLRGIDDDRGRPMHNRLFWNFTKAEGEAAYAMNYNITDASANGFIDESDAMLLFPQGHGDAWGHYLTGIKARYRLLKHPFFNWVSRAEFYSLLDVVLPVDFLDERKFAEAAAARAQTGAEIVNLTYRARYVEDPDGQWQGYTDLDSNRGWGVTEWAKRAGQAAYFDWVTANALLPTKDTTHEGIARIDRTVVPEIAKISANHGTIQTTYDNSNTGLNPLGLDPDVVPFDLDPTFLDVGSTAAIIRPPIQGTTHFEQIYERAYLAVNNALAALSNADQIKGKLRQETVSEDVLRRDAEDQDREYRNRLIEIFGTPYEGTIGTGKPYPAGYTGPDLSMHMYVDVRDVNKETVPPPSAAYHARLMGFVQDMNGINTEFKTSFVPRFSNMIDQVAANLVSWTNVFLTDNETVVLNLPATAGTYTFQALPEWGTRAAPGRLQAIISDMVQTEADLAFAIGNYDVLINQIENAAALLTAKNGLATETLKLKRTERDGIIGFNVAIQALRLIQSTTMFLAEFSLLLAESTKEGFPTVLGFANDTTSAARSAIRFVGAGTQQGLRGTALGTGAAADALDAAKEHFTLDTEISILGEQFPVDIQEQLKELNEYLINEGTTRIAIFRLKEQLRAQADQYRAALQEGVRLIEEREVLNQRIAARAQQNRYQDMTYRVARNEALQKFRASFDLASRYVYMAAKAYDFETNLSPNDRGSAQPLLTEIVRQRTLGILQDGQPQHRGGLGGVLAALVDNFRALEGQLGLNNLQMEFNEFSLRREAFGIGLGSENDGNWRAELRRAQVANLWDVPEFRRFCRPFAARNPSKPEPGIILKFGTQVVAGKNFFGRSLSAGDSIYDPSTYATKIRSVAVTFDGYDSAVLSATPRIYLIPAGMDVMYLPNSSTLETRMWNLVDQRVPVPHQTSLADLDDPDWIPAIDGLNGPLGEIRRFSSFRAYPPLEGEDEPGRDTRIVGRSVWNTQWLMVIPGQTFLADSATGLESFINEVMDIKLNLESYGMSGN